jgi:hypothetical protein
VLDGLRRPRAAANASADPAAAVAAIVAETQSKPVGGDESPATRADATVVLSCCPPHARRTAYSLAADAAIEDGGGGTADGSQVVTDVGESMNGCAEAVGTTIAAVPASVASALISMVFERI